MNNTFNQATDKAPEFILLIRYIYSEKIYILSMKITV